MNVGISALNYHNAGPWDISGYAIAQDSEFGIARYCSAPAGENQELFVPGIGHSVSIIIFTKVWLRIPRVIYPCVGFRLG